MNTYSLGAEKVGAQYDANGMAFQNWENLYNFIEGNNMADPNNYAYVESQLDVPSLCSSSSPTPSLLPATGSTGTQAGGEASTPKAPVQKWGYILAGP